MELLVLFALHIFFSHCNSYIVIFVGLWIKNVFHTNYLVHKVLQFEKNMAHPFKVLNVIFVVSYYNELTLVRRPTIGNNNKKKIESINLFLF